MNRQFVFLSPHRDDTCFSTGMLARMLNGTILNCFTVSQYTVATVNDFSASTVESVSRLRREEDRRFIKSCDLMEVDFGWSEAPLRGLEPFGQKRDPEAVRMFFANAIVRELLLIAQNTAGQECHLFCPIGIREHVDHVIVRDSILDSYEILAKWFELHFYEDLPYAAHALHREAALRRFLNHDFTCYYRRWHVCLEGEEEQKLALLKLYPSQFEHYPQDLANFTPAVDGLPPHEAVWTRDPAQLASVFGAVS
jgi:hypothetical protein